MLNARDIQARLMVERYRRNFVLPNYTPHGWYECDVFELTPAGYMREYEIKLTKGDFKADAEKCKRGRGRFVDGFWYGNELERKHHRLAARDIGGPSLFWYVCPEGLIALADLPEWAGLMEAVEWQGHRRPWKCHLTVKREAPRLHTTPAPAKIKEHGQTIPYYRMHSLICHGRYEDETNEQKGEE
jgi:hypothetical protein